MATKGKKNHVFGPVLSRRLGQSLGVDILASKSCTFDCIYCQIGRSDTVSPERKRFVDPDEVIAELEQRLNNGTKPDYITFSGSGEPTLSSDLGSIISRVREICDIPVAIITNGSLLWMPEVRAECAMADLVMPSIDTATPGTFEKINRPHSSISFEKLLEGLVAFRKEFKGQYNLEIMLIEDMNESDIENLARIVEKIQPDAVEVNTPVRPPAENFVHPLGEEKLAAAAKLISQAASAIGKSRSYKKGLASEPTKQLENSILAMLQRRPCPVEEIASSLSLDVANTMKLLEHLESGGKITSSTRNKIRYYMPHEQAEKM